MTSGDASNVSRCLARLRVHDVRVEPRDPRHIAAFQALRQVNRRITAAAFMTFMDTQQTTVQQSATLTTTFWLCRRADLPQVLPPALADAAVTQEQLQALGAPPGALECIDFEASILLDQVVQRHMLPRGVQTASFALAAVSTYGARTETPAAARATEEPPPSPAPPAQVVGPVAATGAAATGAAATCAAGTGAPTAATGARSLKRNFSAEHDHGEQDGAINEAKRQKDLLRVLMQNISAAAEKGLWFSSDPCQSNTVHFWAKESMAAATGAECRGASPEAMKKVLSGLSRFLTKVLLDSACYDSLAHFVPFFETVKTVEAEMPQAAELVVQLAALKPGGDAALACEGVCLQVRTRFFTSPLWQSYLSRRRAARFEQARLSSDTEQRRSILTGLKADDELEAAMKDVVTVVWTLTDPALPLDTKVRFALEDAHKMKVALDWLPRTDVALAARLCEPAVDLKTSFPLWASFRSTATLVLRACPDLPVTMAPSVRAALVFVRTMDSHGTDEAATGASAVGHMLRDTLAYRCAALAWTALPEPPITDLASDIPAKTRERVLRAVTKYLAGPAHAPRAVALPAGPFWLPTLRTLVETDAVVPKAAALATTEPVAKEQPAAATGALGEGWTGTAFLEGQVVVMHTKTNKEWYDGRRGKVLAVLTNHLRLLVLDGPKQGGEIRRPFGMVTPVPAVAALTDAETPQQGEKDAEGQATKAATGADNAWEDFDNIFPTTDGV